MSSTTDLVVKTKGNLEAIKEEINLNTMDNCINGEPLEDFMFQHFLNRVDPVEYCENVLRGHLPQKQQKLHENQTALIRAVCNPNLKQVAGMMSRQSGKCFAKGTEILMFNGRIKKVEDIQVGDKVMTPHSGSATVVALGHGFEEMFEIKSYEKYHEPFTVNKSHILSLIDKTTKEIINIAIEDYLNLIDGEKDNLFGYRDYVEFEEIPLNIDPYFVGLWLGDGNKTNSTISNIDKEVIEYIDDYAKKLNCYCKHTREVNGHIIDHIIRTCEDNDREKWKNNPIYKELLKMNLINNKHIPDEIMYNSLDIRRKCLAGIIDSDGVSKRFENSHTCEVLFQDRNLSYQLLRLCRSIGLRANITTKNTHLNGKEFMAYRVTCYGDLSVVPTKIPRKQFDNGNRDNPLYFKFHVKSKGVGEYFGFTIDSDEKLFLLGDYTVTHNTESIASFSGFLIDNYPSMRVGIFTPRLQQAEVSIGRLSTFFQMNEDKLNHKIVKLTKDKIELDNKSYVTAVSASDQSNIEGLTFDVICLDEAQKVSDYTFSERIVPMGSGTNAKIIQIGTPKTRNHFYDAVEGKAHDKWTVVRRDWTMCAQSWALGATYLPDPKTGIMRPYSSFILNQAMPKALKQEMFPNNPEVWTEGNLSIEDFKTQYMLEFIDGAGKFLTSQQVEQLTSGEYEWLDHGIIGEYYVAGIDFAGSNPEGDATQISVLRVTPNGIKQKVFAKEFRDCSYPEQMYEISKLFGGINPRFEVQKIYADYTGCGAPVIQTLKEEFGLLNLEGIIFNSSDKIMHTGMNMKNLMYGKFIQELDNGKFLYPSKESFIKSKALGAGEANKSYYLRMVGEWADLECTVTHSVNKKIEAPSGYHDDVCDSDILANFAVVVRQASRMPRPSSARLFSRG